MRHVLVPLTIRDTLPPAGSEVIELNGATMGTSWSVQVAASVPPDQATVFAQDLSAALQQELDTVVAQMSHWVDGSNLSRFNRGAAGSWHALPEPMLEVVQYAMWVSHISCGAYDPFAGALVKRWGFGASARFDEAGFSAPSEAEINALMAQGPDTAFQLGQGRVELDLDGRRLRQLGGAMMDLSSIAKGFAVDLLGRRLGSMGFDHYLVEVGGELRGAGLKPYGQPWWVELEAVPDAPQLEQTVVALHGLAVATSGDYRRHYQHGGQRASHTIDPRTGYPIQHDVASVSVVHASCMAADALSTALTVLGPEHGMRLAEQQQLAARFVVRRPDGVLEQSHSPAWQAMLQ
jgi:thiamine biosynthesis lipoprotein